MTKHNDNTQLDDLKKLFKARIIQEILTKITDMPFSYMDLDGKWIGKPSDQNLSVLKLVNASKVGREKCLDCDKEHKDAALASGKSFTYVSQTGLTNFVVPIKIEGRNMGVIIGGQVLNNEIDDSMRGTFKDVAKDLQIDESKILIEAKEIQIKKKSDLDNTITMIEEMVPFICELELEKVEEKRNRIKRDEQIESLQEVGMTITSNLNLYQVLAKIVKSAKEVLNADVTTIYLYKPETNEFESPPLTEGHIIHEQTMKHSINKDDVLHKILEKGEPHFAVDAANDRVFNNRNKGENSFVIREKIKSSATLPLRIGDDTVGILFINYRVPHRFASDDKIIIKSFASQAAIAIQNARLYEQTNEELKKETKKLNILYDVGKKVYSTFELDHILNLILEKGREFTGAHKGTAYLYNPNTDELILSAKIGEFESMPLKPIKEGSGIIGTAAKEKKSIIVSNVKNDSRYLSFNDETMSELAIPMLWGKEKELIGVLDFEHPEINAFSEDDKKLLEALAYSVTIAVKNVDLYKRIVDDQKLLLDKAIQDQITMTDFVQEIERYLNSDEFNLSGLLRKARDKIAELVNAKHGCILGRDEDDELTNLLLCNRIEDAKDCKERMTNMMVNDAFENHNIIDCPNIEENTRYNSEERWPDAISNLVIPVPDEHDGVICILTLSSKEPYAFHSREKILAKRFATLTALVLNDARRMMKLKEKNKWLTCLFDVIIDLKNESKKIDAVFRHIVDLASETFHVGECSLFMLDEGTNKVTLRASLNHLDEKVEHVLSYEIGEGITGAIVDTGKLIRRRNIQEHIDYSEKYQAYMRKTKPTWESRSFLGVPLKINNKCVGVLQLHNRNKTDDHPYNWFSKEDEDLLSALGDIVAIAIDKYWIFKKLSQSEKMADIGSLTAGTTHGFKQPMQIIKNQVDMLKRKEALKPYIDKINTIDNQIHIMHEIVDVFSRFLNPNIEKNKDVNILLNQTFEVMKIPGNININKKYIQVHNINCDPGQIKQVFQNMILNGCEAMPNGGGLKVSISENNGMINITFEDNGEGIPDFAIEKIFDPFFTTKKSKGTGLGLYISQFIIQNHKGNIYLKSDERKGSIFVVELPVTNYG